MKFLCVSDQIDPLVYSSNIKERFGSVDAILCAGDLSSDYIDFIVSSLNKPAYFVFGNHNLNGFHYYHKQKNTHKGPHPTHKKTWEIYDMTNSFGAEYAGFRCIADKSLMLTDLRTHKKRPLLIAGASGSNRYNNGLCQYTQRQMKWKLFKLWPKLLYNRLRWGTYCDIFLTHASPRHIHDKEDPCHQGFECFNWFIRKFHPQFLVHGHIHLYNMDEPRVTVTGDTTVVNAYSYTIIEIKESEENR